MAAGDTAHYPCTMASTRTRFRLFGIVFICFSLALIACHTSPSIDAQSTATATSQPPATILIIRHGEKLPSGDPDLSPQGYARAQLLLKAFVPLGVRPDLPTPQYIFAAAPSHHSNRSALTVIPLSEALHLAINQEFKDRDYADLAAELLSGEYSGKVVLISWHHGMIPNLATALGATPPYNPWPEDQFDRIWRIDYTNGNATLQDLPYELPTPPAK
jgi:broad specificity phosphatase PhoE